MAPPAVTVENPDGAGDCVLVCEHASNFIAPEYAGLGLLASDLERHIAWDIGAAALARRLSALLDAPLFLAGYSRLLIDCNRPLGAPTSIPTRSEATIIPGNVGIDAAEAARRAAAYFTPFQSRIAACLDARVAAGRPTAVVGVHSFTPVFLGEARVWQAGILFAEAKAFGGDLLAALRRDPGLVVGDNEPYRIEAEHDYTVPVHGDARRLPAALIEVRQDLLADATAIGAWATRLHAAIRFAGYGRRIGASR